jgi:hypothetical protein
MVGTGNEKEFYPQIRIILPMRFANNTHSHSKPRFCDCIATAQAGLNYLGHPGSLMWRRLTRKRGGLGSNPG